MKAFFRLAPFFALSLAGVSLARAAEPTISGPQADLRKAPLFESETIPLSKLWGPSLPLGVEFHIEKVYGRWVYGAPEPLRGMKPSDYAKPGWVFSRMLLMPGDSDTISPKVQQSSRAVLYHSQEAWRKLQVGSPPLHTSLDFLESLTLSRGTLNAFIRQDESSISSILELLPPFFPSPRSSAALPLAHAAEDKKDEPAPMGLSGTDLKFLDQEFQVIQSKKNKEAKEREAKRLKPPLTPALDTATQTGVLGRFMMQKYLELPPLTHEEVDGHVYMRAIAMRALSGCPKQVQDYWKNRRWNLFRFYRLKSRPEVRHPWLEISMPGGYFAYSARAIDLAGNEAELAFLLVRQLVRETRVKRAALKFQKNSWPLSLQSLSEEVWSQVLKAQSTKDSENLDVADEIAVDHAAIECLSRSGYRPMAGISYLRKLSMKKEEPWAKWFLDHSIGLEYRLERILGLVEESLSLQKFPEGKVSNLKRFSTAVRNWNLMP